MSASGPSGPLVNLYYAFDVITDFKGAQWLSGRVLDSRPRGRGFGASPASLHCGP